MLNLYYNSHVSDGIKLSYCIQTWHGGRLMAMHGKYFHAHVNDLDLDARSQWVGKGKKISVDFLTTKQAVSIKLAKTLTLATVGHFYVTLTFKTFTCLDHLSFFSKFYFLQL